MSVCVHDIRLGSLRPLGTQRRDTPLMINITYLCVCLPYVYVDDLMMLIHIFGRCQISWKFKYLIFQNVPLNTQAIIYVVCRLARQYGLRVCIFYNVWPHWPLVAEYADKLSGWHQHTVDGLMCRRSTWICMRVGCLLSALSDECSSVKIRRKNTMHSNIQNKFRLKWCLKRCRHIRKTPIYWASDKQIQTEAKAECWNDKNGIHRLCL